MAAIRAIDAEIGGLDLILANAGMGLAIDAKRLRWERVSQVSLASRSFAAPRPALEKNVSASTFRYRFASGSLSS